jgi:DNA-binding transcriptional LysR family regulator
MVTLIEERDWIILNKIGEGKNISQVSEELYISQPALTYRINKIEKFFGTKLFFRGNKGVKPNNEGEYIIEYARRMIKELKKVREEVISMSSLIKGKLYIGASNAIAQFILPDLLAKFVHKYPSVEPHVFTGFSPYLIDLLNNEKIHVAFLRENLDWAHFKSFLSEENIYIVSKEPISILDLPDLPRINYKTNQSLKTDLDFWWSNFFQKPPNVTMEVDNAEVCIEFVRSGLGYAILTELGLTHEKKLCRSQIIDKDQNPLKRETWIYGSKEASQYYTVQVFMDFIKEEGYYAKL